MLGIGNIKIKRDMTQMLIEEYLKKDNNNLDLVRLIAALLVIVGHSYALAPANGRADVLGSLFDVMYSGAIAVAIFFFVSGLLVTNSLLSKKSSIEFIISRFFRIYPALVVVTLISLLFLGPIVTEDNLTNYFNSNMTILYLFDNLKMNIGYYLPGVFIHNHFKDSINGSLWTIPFEIKFYFFLLAFFLLGLFKNKVIATAFGIFIIFSPFYLPLFHTSNGEVYYLPVMFAFGSLLALHKNKIFIDGSLFFGGVLLTYLFKSYSVESYTFMLHCTIGIGVLYISSLVYVKKIKIKYDISYGVYIYAWPVQQTLNYIYPEKDYLFNCIIAILITIPLGFLSWILIEKKAIYYGKQLYIKLNSNSSHSNYQKNINGSKE